LAPNEEVTFFKQNFGVNNWTCSSCEFEYGYRDV